MWPDRVMHHPTSATVIPADRRKASGEGRIGGPCHTVKTDGYWCTRKATMVDPGDGYGYCTRHAPKGD